MKFQINRDSLLLLNERPYLICQQDLASVIGDDEAMFLQRVHQCCLTGKYERKGFQWCVNSLKNWSRFHFTQWSVAKVHRVQSRLRDMGLLVIGNCTPYNDRTLAYRVNYERLEGFINSIADSNNEKMAPDDLSDIGPDLPPEFYENEKRFLESEKPDCKNEIPDCESEKPDFENVNSSIIKRIQNKSTNKNTKKEIQSVVTSGLVFPEKPAGCRTTTDTPSLNDSDSPANIEEPPGVSGNPIKAKRKTSEKKKKSSGPLIDSELNRVFEFCTGEGGVQPDEYSHALQRRHLQSLAKHYNLTTADPIIERLKKIAEMKAGGHWRWKGSAIVPQAITLKAWPEIPEQYQEFKNPKFQGQKRLRFDGKDCEELDATRWMKKAGIRVISTVEELDELDRQRGLL